jgi:hypothetical protein
MNEIVSIRRATDESAVVQALADVLLDCVEGGAFMHPLPRPKAIGFWQVVLASAARSAVS